MENPPSSPGPKGAGLLQPAQVRQVEQDLGVAQTNRFLPPSNNNGQRGNFEDPFRAEEGGGGGQQRQHDVFMPKHVPDHITRGAHREGSQGMRKVKKKPSRISLQDFSPHFHCSPREQP